MRIDFFVYKVHKSKKKKNDSLEREARAKQDSLPGSNAESKSRWHGRRREMGEETVAHFLLEGSLGRWEGRGWDTQE